MKENEACRDECLDDKSSDNRSSVVFVVYFPVGHFFFALALIPACLLSLSVIKTHCSHR